MSSDSLQYIRDERRKGIFRIRNEHVFNVHVRKALAQCLIVRAECRFDCDAIEYIAYCPDFAPVPQGCEITKYRLYMRPDGVVCWGTFDCWRPLHESEAIVEY